MVAPAVPEYVLFPVYVFPGLRAHGHCSTAVTAAAAEFPGIVTNMWRTI
jgi:hypothetical protein